MLRNCGWIMQVGWMVVLVGAMALPGCRKAAMIEAPPPPDYGRPLPPGAFALRKVTDPARMPDLALGAEAFDDPAFRDAIRRSLAWFRIPSTVQHFPSGPITHEHAWASVYALSMIREQSPQATATRLAQEFDVWESVGWDGKGTVLYTGYYTPVFEASATRTEPFQHPLYKRPADLVTDPTTGVVLGRRVADGFTTYPARAEIENSNMLAGLELVYLPSRLDAYIVQVNGSARLRMTDGSTRHVGYAGNNGHDYTSIGRILAEEGKIDRNQINLAAIRAYFQRHPDQLDHYIQRNDRFVFFQDYSGEQWPAGSLGFRVTPRRSLATDKSVFPRGVVTLVHTQGFDDRGQPAPFRQYMLDQDTGGAIRAAGRADIYFGVGARAEWYAGRQLHEGRLYYLLLKDERLDHWVRQMRSPMN